MSSSAVSTIRNIALFVAWHPQLAIKSMSAAPGPTAGVKSPDAIGLSRAEL